MRNSDVGVVEIQPRIVITIIIWYSKISKLLTSTNGIIVLLVIPVVAPLATGGILLPCSSSNSNR